MTIAEFVMKRDGEHDPYYEVSVTEWNVKALGPYSVVARISFFVGHATQQAELSHHENCLIAKKGHLRKKGT